MEAEMKKFLLHLVANAIALYVAVYLLRNSGITVQNSNWLTFLWLALIFGVVNATIKPLLTVLTCPLIILTLGFGTLLINTLLFVLAGWIGAQFQVGFTVDGFMPAFLGALIVSVVSFALNLIFGV
jgi:putative membrane protein